MAATRKVEVFSAGCAVCEQAIEMVRNAARSSCEIIVHDMKDTRRTLELPKRPRRGRAGIASGWSRTTSLNRILQNRRFPPPW